LNRTVSPESRSSNYALGFEQPGNKPVQVYYHAGAVNGFECCMYIMPKCRAFLIVLADTTGRVDATDHVARLILQTLFQLKPRDSERVDIPAMAKLGAEERADLLAKFKQSQSVPDDDTTIHPSELVGTYTYKKYRQTFLVTEKGGTLWAQWQDTDGHPKSGEMQLLRVNVQLVRMKVRFTIDHFDALKDLDLTVVRDSNQRVTSLRRRDPNDENNFLAYIRFP
jgi:hypothetical protein